MKIQELRQLSSEELREKEKTFKKDLYQLNLEKKMGRVEKPARFKSLRREIARMLTILKEKERELKK